MTQKSMSKKAMHFFMVTATAVYEKDEAHRQRSLNLLLELPSPNITQQVLDNVNTQVIKRVNAENQVSPEMMRDIILQNIVHLAHLPPEKFHDLPQGASN